tara:strand:+ start:2119 stop:3318 length:1200 start_codon:yes stop_codon:yes gene_type:complete
MRNLSFVWLAAALLAETAFAAGAAERESFISEETAVVPIEVVGEVVANYGRIVSAAYVDAQSAAEILNEYLKALVAEPSNETLNSAKEAWRQARNPYLQTEAFRFYAGPIDDANGPEPMINGWPIDEFHIDYVEGVPDSGIINQPDQFPVISKELIAGMNERAGETAITCGFHAIEFLLWGQDKSDAGPGERPVSDYTDGRSAERRCKYLLVCGELLVDHLTELVDQWAPGVDENFRAGFEKGSVLDSAQSLLYGIHVLSGKELGGERLLVAWDTQDQEDEHSCFSDHTHMDVRYDALGIENVYRGRYRKSDGELMEGPGVRAFVRQFLPDQLKHYDSKIDEVMIAVQAIQGPFDQAILGDDESPGRETIIHAVEQLEDFAAMLSALDRALLEALREDV